MTVTIQNLGCDILHEIFGLITAHSRTLLLDCILVCKSWRAIAQPMLDRRIEFCLRLSSVQNDAKILIRLEDEGFQANVRELVIGRFYWDSHRSVTDGASELDALAEPIKNMRLHKLIWNRIDPFPPSTWVEAIENQQDCEVHIRLETNESYYSWTRGQFGGYMAWFLPSLEPIASRLVTLQTAHFSPTQSPISLGRVVSRAERLRSLSITTKKQCDSNWEWLSSPLPGPLNLRQLTLNNFCVCQPSTWDKWKDLVAWENLKEATFTCPSVICKAGSRLRGLNKLQITAYNPSQAVDLSQSHSDKISIQGMLQVLGAELKELRFCGLAEAFDPDCVSHLRSLRTLLLRRLVFPGERQHTLQILTKALSLTETNHPHLKEITVQLPYSPADVHQLDVPLSNIVGNLSYVDHLKLIICNDIASEDRTWDFSPAKRIWDYFESFPSRHVQGEGSIFAAASRPSVQTMEIRVVLQVIRTRNRDMVCDRVELTRQWKIRHLPLAPTVSIEPITFEKDMWKDSRWNSSTYQFQNGLASFFAQAYPELDQFVDIQYVFAGDLFDYLRAQNERRAAGI